ncbi:hypothetical protein RUM43_013678 [Polyplax serrata]|uniref:Uncharacterized protein n=1 Tax=Polyplax serrata TaxID=468196 RepID=A0AAN8RZU6_POLSC
MSLPWKGRGVPSKQISGVDRKAGTKRNNKLMELQKLHWGTRNGKTVVASLADFDTIQQAIGENRCDGNNNFKLPGVFVNNSAALMKRLLIDAQAKFRKMVDENKQLVSRVDGEMRSTGEQTSNLQEEVPETNKRLEEHINSKMHGDILTGTREDSANRNEDTNKTRDNRNLINSNVCQGDREMENSTSKSNTNPFADNFDSINEIAGSKLPNFFTQKKGVDFFSSKLSDFTGNFSGSGKRGTGFNRSELFGNGDKSLDETEKKENSFVDCIASKIFKGTTEAGSNGASARGSIKPEDFVVTSNLKLNFLTKSSVESPKKTHPERNTGAVPKRSKTVTSENGSKTNGNQSAAGSSEVEGMNRTESRDVDTFVRPMSPIATKQGKLTRLV